MSSGMPAVSVAVAANFETEETIGMWSSSWSEPDPQRRWGARPPSTRMGEPFR